jgi:hypothetical protein
MQTNSGFWAIVFFLAYFLAALLSWGNTASAVEPGKPGPRVNPISALEVKLDQLAARVEQISRAQAALAAQVTAILALTEGDDPNNCNVSAPTCGDVCVNSLGVTTFCKYDETENTCGCPEITTVR